MSLDSERDRTLAAKSGVSSIKLVVDARGSAGVVIGEGNSRLSMYIRLLTR